MSSETATRFGKMEKEKRMRWMLSLIVTAGIVLTLFWLPDLLLCQRTEPNAKAITHLAQPLPTDPAVKVSLGSASILDANYQAQKVAFLNDYAEYSDLIRPVDGIKNLLNEPPNLSRLREYSVVMEFPRSSSLGSKPVVLNGDLLYEHAMKRFEAEGYKKANSALYVQAGAVQALVSFIGHEGNRMLVREFLRSRLEYPTASSFKIGREAAGGGYSRVVCEYVGPLSWEGRRVFCLLLREGEHLSEQQQSQYLEQCALDIAVRSMKQQMKLSDGDNPAVQEFLKDPSERTLGSLLQKQGKVSIEIPDFDPYSAAMLQLELKLPGLTLRPSGRAG